MGELLSEFGDLVFTLVIGYIGAIEFLYVVRHLYHWSFNHDAEEYDNDADRLANLQENMRNQLTNATNTENKAGTNVMQDGVQYKDGFRIDPLQDEIDKLKEQLKDKELQDLQRKELEKELAKLQKVAEQTLKELEQAEAAKRREEEEEARKLKEAEEKREREQRQREEEQVRREAEENNRKLAEAEKQREAEQRKKEEEEEQARREVEENNRKLVEAEKQREQEQRKKEEEQAQREIEENNRKLAEAEKQREQEQRRKEEEEDKRVREQLERDEEQREVGENNRKLQEAEKLREQEQRINEEEEEELKQKQEEEETARRLVESEKHNEEKQAAQENERLIVEAEQQREEEQRQLEEEEENERKFLEIEHKLEEQLRAAEQEADLTEKERQLIESIKQRDLQEVEHNEQKEAELLRRILAAQDQLGDESEEEQTHRLFEREQDQEAKQRRIEENALLFLEAEKEMAEIQQQMQQAVEKRMYASNLDSAPQTPVLEEPCIKKIIAPLLEDEPTPPISQRVKTQLAQDLNESYSVTSKPLLFPGLSDEGSSVEPNSSQQSSFSTQPSEEVTTGPDSQYPPQQERQEPDGEDTTPSLQYTEDYLRSLDGIKQRPLIREDGSGRRRAFKKRRSSNSSNSSRESRTSRDEELKMFTSLEEEEMKTTGDSEFTPIRYTSEPTLKVKGHHRRHKRSPAKDMKSNDSLRSSLERLGEETSSDPWGEVMPEHYKNTEFWKREKTLSIDEELEFERPASSEEIAYDTATNMPSASSFEEATQIQNEQALTALQKQASKESREKEELDDRATFEDESARSDNKTNLQTSQSTEKEASPARLSASPRLRRSPRIEESDQYEERCKENNEATSPTQTSSVNTPSITVQSPLDFGSWRDEHGLMMQGLSDFYDFTASVNPSRSRNTSRNPSPANTAPNTPLPKDVTFDLEIKNSQQSLENTIEIYDDTDDIEKNEFKKENIIEFIDSLNGNESNKEEVEYELSTELNENALEHKIKYVMDDLSKGSGDHNSNLGLVPMVNIIEDSSFSNSADNDTHDDMNTLVAALRTQRSGGSRSRSKSPLPTPGNLERGLENRRNKMIRHNEDILEKLIESNLLPESPPTPEELEEEASSKENMNLFLDSLRVQRSEANSSRSRSRSPLPTAENIERSLEHRRNKRIQENDELFEKLNSPDNRSESPVIVNASFLEESAEMSSTIEEITVDSLIQTLRVDQRRSRSKSPMRLPSADNLNKSIDSRRHKLIERNDEIQKQFEERTNTPESPNLTVEYVYEFETSEQIENIAQTTLTKTESPQILQTPTISIEFDDTVEITSPKAEAENDDCSREQMDLLVQSLRVARSRSRTPVHRRSRSKSPMRLPSADNLNKSIDFRRQKLIERNDELQQQLEERTSTPETPKLTVEYVYETADETASQIPAIIIESAESDQISSGPRVEEDPDDCSREKMDSLVQSLRVARSRSRSKSPMRLPTADNLNKSLDSRRHKLIERNDELEKHLEEKAKTPEPPRLNVEYVYEFESSEETDNNQRSRHSRSNTPSRSFSRSLSSSKYETEYDDFNVMLNLEGSDNKTLSKNSEELESLKLQRQRRLDEEALETLKNASEEMELRTLSPLALDHDELNEQQSKDYLADLPITERAKILRKSPTTPDYERTISEEMLDVKRIKQDMLEKGFKRSTYVGESLDMGSEYEPLRREAAKFQRSHSPSPSFSRTDIETAQLKAEEKRKIQDMILAELTGSTQDSNQIRNTGAIPKTERLTSTDSDLSLSTEIQDTLRIREEMLKSDFQRSTYVGESLDMSLKYEEMRRRNAEFRRSASKSRSPLKKAQLDELAEIEKEAAKRELQDKVLDEISNNSINFQDFSRHLNPDFFENDRRASDSALIQKPEILVQFQDNNYDSNMDIEPEEYHHFRRYSLAQEQPIEEYPSDDYIYFQQVEVRTRSGSRTWIREDFYSDDVNEFLTRQEVPAKSSTDLEMSKEKESDIGANTEETDESLSDIETNQSSDILDDMEENLQHVAEDNLVEDDEEYSNNSDDDRQTVVEVDDEIDEDISDFKAEESHHEISECEEADREIDRYADRRASDWNQVANVAEENEGAVGGSTQSPYDSDSFAIDQIYDEAVKNRKQSGILREYDSILMQMSKSDIDEQYALWSKTQAKKKPKNVEFNVNFLENERKDTEIRYLGDAKVMERQSVRLRSRYGYNPVLQTNQLDDDIEVDLNYKPKREYNWRKNFKLDEDSNERGNEALAKLSEDYQYKQEEEEEQQQQQMDREDSLENPEKSNVIDMRKYSLGGESITLFSRSPERSILEEDYADNADIEEVIPDLPTHNDVYPKHDLKEEIQEKPKKKKTKKKSRKESRGSLEFVNKDEEDVPDSYIYSRRSSSIQMDTDSPKRKSRSRRNSKSSLTNDDSLFSPRSSVGYAEPIADIMEEYTETVQETVRPKKIKKRKKVKETMANVSESPIENKEELQYNEPIDRNVQPISAIVTPESSSVNILSTLSPQNSVCVTPASIEFEMNGNLDEAHENSVATTSSPTSPTAVSSSSTSPTTSFSRTSSITSPVDTFDILKDANFYPLF